jgi:D-beta-D-heptose 7-phosphate kinase / D-beta-D-heptose 1-phosphate adenosyltransferase
MRQEDLQVKDLQRVLHLVESGFQSVQFVVVGDVMLDRYVWGSVDRISPEAPVPILRSVRTTQVPGGAANVAMNLAGLGARVSLAGFWGNDVEQRALFELLQPAGIDCSAMVVSSHPTVTKTRIVARHQQLLRMDVENLAPRPDHEYERLLNLALPLISTADAVILSDYAKATLISPVCRALIEAAQRRTIPVLVDPKEKSFAKYSGATTICPNLSELSATTGVAADNLTDLIAAGERLVSELEVQFLTVTMSEKGILALFPDSSIHSPARAREVFDVSGAGDTAIATMGVCLARRLDVESATGLANVAAGIVVGKAGTAPVSRSELLAELTAMVSRGMPDKLLDHSQLRIRIAEWRAAGQRVVFTNGCFDILHVGHISLLEHCRQFGDRVVVAINSDESVRLLKGPTRPIVGQEERARVLAALASIDAVTVFEAETPIDLIRSLRPDVLVKGGDYIIETVVGADDVLSWGGRVEIVPIVPGYSTTQTIARMNNP